MRSTLLTAISALSLLFAFSFNHIPKWESKLVRVTSTGDLEYYADAQANVLPDFSRVGYAGGDKPLPSVPVVETVSPAAGNSESVIQNAIHKLAQRAPDRNGFRGAILLKKGVYRIPGSIKIETSGIVLRG
ncbi:MAG TPA: hypothetical protein VNR87_11170, partial [Flavisolibacter sp.]|nr:hypothetical protein [Flavisolibacter sp.]